jgi:hypothetical protein
MEEGLQYQQAPQLIELIASSAVSDLDSYYSISSTCANTRNATNNGGTSPIVILFQKKYCNK